MEKKYKLLWFGVTPIEEFSERSLQLCEFFHEYMVCYPSYVGGMGKYEQWKSLIQNYDAILTDEETIDESWEDFFEKCNWNRKILKYQDGEWKELEPNFSKKQSRN